MGWSKAVTDDYQESQWNTCIKCFTVSFHIRSDSATNDVSKIRALSINLGFPNGIAIKPNTVIETKVNRAAR